MHGDYRELVEWDFVECNKVRRCGKKEAGTGEHSKTLMAENKTKVKAPHEHIIKHISPLSI